MKFAFRGVPKFRNISIGLKLLGITTGSALMLDEAGLRRGEGHMRIARCHFHRCGYEHRGHGPRQTGRCCGGVGAAAPNPVNCLTFPALIPRAAHAQPMSEKGQGHCHVNRQDTQGSVSAVFQAATLAFSQTPNASVRNRLNVDLLSK